MSTTNTQWVARDLHENATIRVNNVSTELTTVYMLDPNTVFVSGIRTQDGEYDEIELAADTLVDVTSF